jgi:hypothetical protein
VTHVDVLAACIDTADAGQGRRVLADQRDAHARSVHLEVGLFIRKAGNGHMRTTARAIDVPAACRQPD